MIWIIISGLHSCVLQATSLQFSTNASNSCVKVVVSILDTSVPRRDFVCLSAVLDALGTCFTMAILFSNINGFPFVFFFLYLCYFDGTTAV